jgi:hypothetical protein
MPARRRCPPYVRAPGHPRRRSRVQVCTAPSSSPEPQAGAPPAPGSPAGGTTPRAPPGRTPPHPACSGSLPPQQARAPAVCPRCASRYFPQTRATGQRRNYPGPAHQTQTHPIGPGQHENDHDTRAAQAAPSSGSACSLNYGTKPQLRGLSGHGGGIRGRPETGVGRSMRM